VFPPYEIRQFQGIPVAFIGLTLKGTPDIVSPVGVAGLDRLERDRGFPRLDRPGGPGSSETEAARDSCSLAVGVGIGDRDARIGRGLPDENHPGE